MTIDQTVAAAMRLCRNYFNTQPVAGTFTLSGGVITPTIDAEWLYISGSKKNDGVCHYTLEGTALKDETFTGRIYELRPPRDFLDLCAEIAAYSEGNSPGGVISENFGQYSYNKGSGRTGGPVAWQEAYSASLLPYRKMFLEVE